ncbi:hypothetical protein RFI_03456 [Reticulomyxa filosa]|uniref:Uncharacterized protein n=1 Tax=Reticulomyxa filosa TaxID=46433 RepID=X6P624_RETFI|nr:hypothetical protein RFI_03456 [Reticulomyxa filosa]|eukprot:ETO33646.1 hypothetical protein RFI_03456 [Reticulomyxa filosa]
MSVMQERESTLMMEELSNTQDQESVMQKLADIGERVKDSSLSKSRLSTNSKESKNVADNKEQDIASIQAKGNVVYKKHIQQESKALEVDRDKLSLKEQLSILQKQVKELINLNIKQSEPYAVPILSERPYVGRTSIVDSYDLYLNDKTAFSTFLIEMEIIFRVGEDNSCIGKQLTICQITFMHDMMIAQNLNNFDEMMSWMCKLFGGKNFVVERIADLLHSTVKFGECTEDILLRWRQTRLSLKFGLDYQFNAMFP